MSGLRSANRTAPHPLSCAGTRKGPSKGAWGSGFVHEVVFSLTREEHVLPRVAACVATVEYDHFVVVNVGVHQIGAGDMAHVQRATQALEYQDLADGVVLAMALTQAPS
ncbi:hypothetical protein [Pseudomonas aeruginosa]|uniref:hypothetical protein n=1 Tax=Pseudomonas aeruginosa TaxID=287 RepID=UPI003F7544CB